MRTLLLLVSMSCFLVAAILAGQWGWFGIEPNDRLIDVWFAAAGLFFGASFLPWSMRFRYWFGRDAR